MKNETLFKILFISLIAIYAIVFDYMVGYAVLTLYFISIVLKLLAIRFRNKILKHSKIK